MKLHVTSGDLKITTDWTNIKSVIKTCIDAGNSDIHVSVTIPPPTVQGSKFKIGDRVIDLATDTEGMAGGATISTVFEVTEIRSQYRVDYKLSYTDESGELRCWYGNDDTLDFAK